MTPYQKMHIKAQTIIQKHKHAVKQNPTLLVENYGEKAYRQYRDLTNSLDTLSHAEKAQLCAFLSDELSSISL